MNEVWHRRTSETEKAFEAFSIYRDLRANRSYVKVGELLGKSSTLIERWAKQHDWGDRVVDFDRYEDAEKAQAQHTLLQKMYEKHADIATLCMEKAENALRQISPTDLTGRDIIAMIKTGMEVEERSRILSNPDLLTPKSEMREPIKYIEFREQKRKPEDCQELGMINHE